MEDIVYGVNVIDPDNVTFVMERAILRGYITENDIDRVMQLAQEIGARNIVTPYLPIDGLDVTMAINTLLYERKIAR